MIPGTPGEAVNWSKLPFAAVETGGLGDDGWEAALLAAAGHYLASVAALGYTAVAVDDLAHLVTHPWYPAALRDCLGRWRRLYRALFALASRHGLDVYVTSDYCFFNPAIDSHLRRTRTSAEDFFAGTLESALDDWPEFAGLVLRLGESDGVDVAGDFASRLTARRPAEARRLLVRLLPLLEGRGKTLVCRTWTLGAHPIGDLIWNPRTWDAVFAGIASPALVLSLKYGEADFFRYLPLNPLFFRGPQPKLIELQCRREYEGMGEFPAFAGWLYERYLQELTTGGANLRGVFAVQGGGWAPFRGMPFAGDGSLWNELNLATVARLAHGQSVAASIDAFCAERGIADAAAFRDLLRLADDAIGEGLYIREFAERPLYFRRVRIPPLLWVFWRHVSTGGLVALVHRALVRDPARAVEEGYRAAEAVERTIALARGLGLDEAPLRFQLATFRLLALHREVLLGVADAGTRGRIEAALSEYRSRYPGGYRFDEAKPMSVSSAAAAVVLRVLLRPRRGYRPADHLHLNRPVSRLLAGVARQCSGIMPAFAGRVGMSPETLLR